MTKENKQKGQANIDAEFEKEMEEFAKQCKEEDAKRSDVAWGKKVVDEMAICSVVHKVLKEANKRWSNSAGAELVPDMDSFMYLDCSRHPINADEVRRFWKRLNLKVGIKIGDHIDTITKADLTAYNYSGHLEITLDTDTLDRRLTLIAQGNSSPDQKPFIAAQPWEIITHRICWAILIATIIFAFIVS